MGQDKRFLTIGERTLFERSLAVIVSVFQEVFVVIAQDSASLQIDVPVLRDLVPNKGSLGGLYTGLTHAGTPYVFVVACDMPFLNPQAVRAMVDLRGQADIVMAKRADGFQPMHALYSRRCLPAMEQMLARGELKVQQLVTNPSFRVKLVAEEEVRKMDPTGQSFLNVNTPADLETAQTWYARRKERDAS